MVRFYLVCSLVCVFQLLADERSDEERKKELKQAIQKLESLESYVPITKFPKDNRTEWMKSNPRESGQLFDGRKLNGRTYGKPFLEYQPHQINLRKLEKVMYVQPIGELSDGQKKVLEVVKEFYQTFFGLKVEQRKPLSLKGLKRNKANQLDADDLNKLVLSRLKKGLRDASNVIGVTGEDLFAHNRAGVPYNYVFGMASPSERINTWSFHRFGEPDKKDQYAQVLRQALRIAIHEAGHNFTIDHCTAYRCSMNGYNSRRELKDGPITFCPECSAKIWWITKRKPAEQLEKLIAFGKKHGLKEEVAIWTKSLKALKPKLQPRKPPKRKDSLTHRLSK